MAYIEKRKNRKGEFVGYRIRAYSGYDVNGKQMVQFKSGTPPKDMSPRQAEKEVQRLAVLFDEECSHGQVTAAVKLQKLCEQWFSEYAELNHRSTTLQREHLIASRVYPALGHLRIDKYQLGTFRNSSTHLPDREQTKGQVSRCLKRRCGITCRSYHQYLSMR